MEPIYGQDNFRGSVKNGNDLSTTSGNTSGDFNGTPINPQVDAMQDGILPLQKNEIDDPRMMLDLIGHNPGGIERRDRIRKNAELGLASKPGQNNDSWLD